MERSPPLSFPNTSSHFPYEEDEQLLPSSYTNFSSPILPFPPTTPAHPFAVPPTSSSWSIHDPSAVSFQTLQQRLAYDAWATKAARNRRKMARQKSIQSSRSSSSFMPTFTPTSQNEKIPVGGDDLQEGIKDDRYVIFSDNKKLKLVFKKKLKNSDVSQLGRIVIPKKDAEENLPPLTEREGIKLVVTDLRSDRHWILKYKFWSNNKSRMYVLENTGDFLKKNGLKMGDTIILYVDEHDNYFFSSERSDDEEKPFCVVSYEPAEEEDAALALLIENLRHSDGQDKEANNLFTVSMEGNTHTSSQFHNWIGQDTRRET